MNRLIQPTVFDIRTELIDLYRNEKFVTDKSGCSVIEICGASFIADEPAIFGSPNEEYIKRELEWYLSGSRFVADIPGKTPAIWEAVSSKAGKINSNYGHLIFSNENELQYLNALESLLNNSNSRQAIMIYTRPSIHTDAIEDGMSDFICTNTVQYLIRDQKLETIVSMRSNDAIFGYPNDYAWQKYVRDLLLFDLSSLQSPITAGSIQWNVGSLHVYERHFKYLQ